MKDNKSGWQFPKALEIIKCKEGSKEFNGLFTFADLSKSRAAQDMFEEIKNGLVTKMSWAFRVSEDSYDRDTRTRTILKIAKVYDVSAVSIPANADIKAGEDTPKRETAIT